MDTNMYNAIHAAMNNLNVALLALLQVKYQNKETSPFEAHGTIMLLYILTCLFYSIAFIALLLRARQLPETLCLATLEHISLLTGALACDLLLLILAPPFGYFLLAFGGVLILVKALQQIRDHDVAAISERARDLIPNVFHRSSPLDRMVSQPMDGVPSNHNSTDQGSGDHNTAPIANEPDGAMERSQAVGAGRGAGGGREEVGLRDWTARKAERGEREKKAAVDDGGG
ncbi:hypothetical protein OIU84_023212 [Salix udensis]|uniref:Uncharacterized protein n=1 Tax=Salix udensis TaxID=889485 RepID=A0AAD6KQK4_9ROSI|nr:hypothetical protein OIU84_023212 [Salix udensis]